MNGIVLQNMSSLCLNYIVLIPPSVRNLWKIANYENAGLILVIFFILYLFHVNLSL